MILLLDNFDSFTHNLVDYFNQLDVDVEVVRNDRPLQDFIQRDYSGVVLSPGPENPGSAGNLMETIAHFEKKLPILGVCLGHQALGLHFGAGLGYAKRPMHGKLSVINHRKKGIFEALPQSLTVVRYHSLVLHDLPDCLELLAEAEGEIMSFKHRTLPIAGVQFHPEAALTQDGIVLLSNWIRFNNIV